MALLDRSGRGPCGVKLRPPSIGSLASVSLRGTNLAPVPRGLRYDTELSMCDHVLLSDLRLHRYLRLPNAVRRASRKRDTHQTPVHQLGELGVPRPSRVVAGRRASPRPAPSWSVVNVLMWCTFLILLTSTSGCGSADPNATAFLQIPTSPR
jgi:hypothetical protein